MNETIEILSQAASQKVKIIKKNPSKYWVSSVFAGALIGLGVLVSFTVGAILTSAHSPGAKLLPALSFSVALSLVIFLSTELFTGNNMIMTIGRLNRSVTTSQLSSVWLRSWVGNLIGSIILSGVFIGTGLIKGPIQDFYSAAALAKVSLSPLEFVTRGIFCNFLVCLAILTCNRTKNDAAKLIIIIMCIYAFMTSGFEHSIADMTVFAIAIMSKSITSIGIGQAAYALFFITIGNIIGGSLLVGWVANKIK